MSGDALLHLTSASAPGSPGGPMTWLVTGGAGCIGLHVLLVLRTAGREAVAIDDLSTGRGDLVEVPLVRGNVQDADLLRDTIVAHGVRGVIHLAAKTQVGESVERPLHHYREPAALGPLVDPVRELLRLPPAR